jgi:hypothetical protein
VAVRARVQREAERVANLAAAAVMAAAVGGVETGEYPRVQVRQQGAARHSAGDVDDMAAAVAPDLAEHVAAEVVAEAFGAAHQEDAERAEYAEHPHDEHLAHDEREVYQETAEHDERGGDAEAYRHGEPNGRHNGHPIPAQRASEQERVGAE